MTEYVFTSNRSDKEYQRLRLLERAFDEKTKSILLESGLKAGFACLEVGPGAGSILEWMKHIVGSSGSVIGVDKNIEHVRHLKKQSITLVEESIQASEFANPFDLIHARYVLIHNARGYELISKLSNWLNPGGILVIEEADFTTAKWINEVYKESGDKVNRAGCAVFRNRGLNPAYGLDVIPDMEKAGLEIVKMSPEMHLAKGRSPVAKVMEESVGTLKEHYIDTGECDKADIDQYIKGTNDPKSLAIYYTTISIIGKKSVNAVDANS